MFCHLTAMQACASMPHRIACLGLPRACSSFSTSSVIIVNEVLVWAFRSSAPSSGTVGPKPLGYCSVSTGGMSRMRLACEEGYRKRHLIKYNLLQMKWYKWVTYGNVLGVCLFVFFKPGAIWTHCWQCWGTGKCWVWTFLACHRGTAPHLWWRVYRALPLQNQSHEGGQMGLT